MTHDPTATSDGPRPTTPPGWYPDPQSTVQTRWWDGQRWTESVQPLVAQAPVEAAKAPVDFASMPLAKRVRLWGWIVGSIFAAIGLVFVIGALVAGDFAVAIGNLFLFALLALIPLATATRGTRWGWWGNLGWSLALVFGAWSLVIFIINRTWYAPALVFVILVGPGLALGIISEVLARRRTH